MVTVINIDTTKFNKISDSLFVSKNSFEKTIINCIFEEHEKITHYNGDKDKVLQYEIILPETLTKDQRYIFHKYSRAGELYTESFNNVNSTRQLSLFLSNKYVQKLIIQYIPYDQSVKTDTTDTSVTFSNILPTNSIESVESRESMDNVESVESNEINEINEINEHMEKNIKKYNKSNIYDNNIVCFMYGFICGICANALVFKYKQE